MIVRYFDLKLIAH